MSEKRLIFTGSAAAMVTPFQQEGLNVKARDRLIDFQLAGGTDALVVCGTTGEPSTMDISEEAVVISRTVERVNRRVPVIAGAGSNDTAFAVMSAKQAKNLGADALLVTPYYNKTSQQGLVRHFLTIADATDLPIILYNVPSRTGLNLQPATLRELAKHENIVAVKEASGNLEQIVEIARSADAYLLCDEVYRHLTQEGGWSESVADLCEKGISVSSMSKVFSLAGIRMSWIATCDEAALKAFLSHRDYNLISCGMFDDAVASLILPGSI